MDILKNLMKNILGKIRGKLYYKIKRFYYSPYDGLSFKENLRDLGIYPGDSIFVMFSSDNIYKSTGYRVPVHNILTDIIEYLGSEGTIMTLAFSGKRQEIIDKKIIFDIKKTQTSNGIFSELLRRKKGSISSLHPIFSAVAYGKKAKEYCSTHQESPYPYDKESPYSKITRDNGKYLGISVGPEAFTPSHIIDDYYKENFKHKMYSEKPLSFQVIDSSGQIKYVESYVRKPFKDLKNHNPLKYFFSLPKVRYKNLKMKSGIYLFAMDMMDYFQSGLKLYEQEKITQWSEYSIPFVMNCRKFLYQLKRSLRRI